MINIIRKDIIKNTPNFKKLKLKGVVFISKEETSKFY